MRLILFLLFSVAGFFIVPDAMGQCASPVAAYPYVQDFEGSDGGWVSGGTAPDWAWGTPVKPVISTAASGTRCWITGGLAGSAYNNGEDSWLQSPCFNFGALQRPRISFSVFWESERRFDGATLQYSTDNGINWTTIGASSDDACIAENWYNNNNITYLGGSNGWSGNIQSNAGSCLGGGGSGGWVTAWHDLSFLAGQTAVLFRFRFGAGTTCNAYDGFAVDDFRINEASVSGTADFSYVCAGANSVTFTPAVTGCANSYTWDFDDPFSGADNTSTSPNPTHVFSTAGTHTVTLTVGFAAAPPVTVTHTITLLSVSIAVDLVLKCNGDQNGAITASATGGNGIYTFQWNTNPVQHTAAISGLGAGTYIVTVSSTGACTTTSGFTITSPPAITTSVTTTNAVCNNNNGSASVTAGGGTAPYQYLWSNGATTAATNALAPGTYSVTVTDDDGCHVSQGNIAIANIAKTVPLSLGNDTILCPGQLLVLQPGTFSGYLWHDNSNGSSFLVTGAGKYWVRVTDADGCTGSDTVNVTANCGDIYFPNAFTPDNNNINDRFGAAGNTGAVSNYSLKVYSRWGQQLFATTNATAKWDGTLNGERFNTGSFIWIATYSINGGPLRMQKGMVTLIR